MNRPESESSERPTRAITARRQSHPELARLAMGFLCSAIVWVVMDPFGMIKTVAVCLFFLYFALGEVPRQAERIARKATEAAEAMDKQARHP